MAVASPVLERKISTDNSSYVNESVRDSYMSADEMHNSRISENYLRLINPESTPRDIIIKDNVSGDAEVRHIENSAPVREVHMQRPYLVENARADADIFRADSAVNKKYDEAETSAVVAKLDEDENEDLRPTQTTIQYKTNGVKIADEDIKTGTKSTAKRTALTKKDKIIIAVALTVIVALFVLIIVNSAVISNLNSEVANLQTVLSTAENSYMETVAEKTAYLEESNLYQVVSDFAAGNGMTLK